MVEASYYVKKNNLTKKYAVSIIFIVLNYFSLNAQDPNDGGIPTAEIVIMQVRQIALPKADRNFDKIPPRQAEIVKHDFSYQLKSLSFNSPDYNPVIRPLKLKDQEIAKLFGNYIAAGFGNYTSPYLEGFINSKRDRNKFVGAHLFHRSFGSGAVDAGNSSSGRTELEATAKILSQNTSLGGKINYENTAGNFYGYIPKKEINKDTLSQHYTRVGADFELVNLKNGKVDYNLDAGVGLLNDNYKAKETELSISAKGKYLLKEQTQVKLGLDYSLLTREDNSISAYSRNLIKVRPTYLLAPIDNLIVDMGLNFVFQNDAQLRTSSFHVFPNLNADYKINANSHAYAGMSGDVDKVSLKTISAENLWIQSNQKISNTNRAYEFAIGLKGKIVQKVSYHAGFSFANLKGYYFYQSDIANRAKFDISYEDGSTKRTNLFVEVGVNQELTRFNLRGDIYGYSRESGLTAFNRPSYKIAFASNFNIYNKLLLNANFIALGGIKALDNEKKTVVDISSAFDVSVKANYLVSKNVSVFVRADNLMGSNYLLYLNYPVRGIQAMVGVSCSF